MKEKYSCGTKFKLTTSAVSSSAFLPVLRFGVFLLRGDGVGLVDDLGDVPLDTSADASTVASL